MRVAAPSAAVVAVALLCFGQLAIAGDSDAGRNRRVEAEATVTGNSNDPPPPPPACWWTNKGAGASDLARERGFWRQIDAGDHYDDVLVFFENGSLQRTFISEQRTYVLQQRVCSDANHEDNGRQRWAVVGPPNPAVYWDELTERVTKLVPLPDPNLGFSRQPDGPIEFVVNVGLWVSVDNSDDVVARAEAAPGIWAETRARLVSIEFISGTGGTSGMCMGSGTPLPEGSADTTDEGPCGYTYRLVDELGEHTAILRATWSVTNTTSTGASEQRADIPLETLIPIRVYEIQTVGTG